MKKKFARTIAASCISALTLSGYAATLEDDLRAFAPTLQKSLTGSTGEDPQAKSVTPVGKTMLVRYQFMAKASTISNVPRLKRDLFRKSVKTSCTDPDLSRLIERGAFLKYEYDDVNGRLVLGYEIDKEACLQAKKGSSA